MKTDFSRRLFIAAMLASVSERAFAKAPLASLRPKPRSGNSKAAAVKPVIKSAKSLISQAKLGGKIGFVVADAKTGLVLETHNPLLAQPPASVTKTITALYALDLLGSGYRFKTRLMATGPISNGRLKGDLVLVGGGDPTLTTDDLAKMAASLKRAGVREISGKFRVNTAALPLAKSIDSSQPDHVGYNPAVSALNLNFNRVYFEWKRRGGSAGRYDVSMDGRTNRYRPAVRFAKMNVVNRELPVYTYKDANGADNWTVARRALGKGGGRWLPVRKPHLYAAEVFQTMARSHGIKLPRTVTSKGNINGQVLVEHKSAELRVLLKNLLKYSNNMTAESIGMMASSASGGTVGSLKASAKEMTAWSKSHSGARKSSFVDHSGLGSGSRLAAGDMVSALVKQGPNGQLAHLLKQIPLRNSKGKVIKGHPVKVHAKTGTLNFVSALAGYITAPDGTQLAFAIFTADEKRRNGVGKADREAPRGSKSWNKASKRLQQGLIERWAGLYGG
ncbi:MAG TPA: D-alanyl-D-alanine carboxypeptidase/D-alanyl-D-alanine-endopeptidase [Rhodobacteraceae bacterium]|jgi:D-alanyl-D-alanine carboxypeptidase/D-alanyl-D-alanine-endopeptidase (penicillin-binding protein 4)|nr:D-alanyl-D-alanine carboxypeptidase/D-alanyl-D-alanine-endopeptidase [Paracoccaceae bacterium]